jgi:hypothetical protein
MPSCQALSTIKANIAALKEQWRCFFTAITHNLKTSLAF